MLIIIVHLNLYSLVHLQTTYYIVAIACILAVCYPMSIFMKKYPYMTHQSKTHYMHDICRSMAVWLVMIELGVLSRKKAGQLGILLLIMYLPETNHLPRAVKASRPLFSVRYASTLYEAL